MKFKSLFLLLFVLITFKGFSQEKTFTMEEAIVGYHLYPENKYIDWQGDKDAFIEFKDNSIISTRLNRRKTKSTLFSLWDINRILNLKLERLPRFKFLDYRNIMVYEKENIHFIDIRKGKLIKTLKSPLGNNVKFNGKNEFAYTKDNNLYLQNSNGDEVAITADSNKNIVNGSFVSRNEFGIEDGIFWSPDGSKIAFYRKDEGNVTEFPLFDISTRTGSANYIKYPMAGMKSEIVSLGVYNIKTNETIFVKVDDFSAERYLTNISWAPNSKEIYIQVLNRAQNHMKLNVYDSENGYFKRTILEEKSDTYVEPQKPIIFLKKNHNKFLYTTNNRDGFFNLYLCDIKGRNITRLTKDNADVNYVGQDGKYVYYTSAAVSPTENHLFKVRIRNGKSERITKENGWHNIKMSEDAKYFIDSYSNLKTPREINIISNNGEKILNILKAKNPLSNYKLGEVSLGKIKAADGKTDLHYRLIKPMNFNPNKKYPTIIYVYGGPHAQLVKNKWLGGMRHWEMLMAQKGYVVFVLDNRGSANRGKDFEAIIHKNCGKNEMLDQMEGFKFLTSHNWVDKDKIGVHGWSYGGFMTISLITNYPNIFKVAVAGGPVIDWKWYEIMYGERYMGNPNDNLEGYERTSLIPMAKKLKGKLLICQGLIDNVVVWQHSLNFIRECIKNNIPVDYFVYPRAEHNVLGKDRIHLMQKVTNYFDDYLK